MSLKLNLNELKVLQRIVTDERERLKADGMFTRVANKTLRRLAGDGIGELLGKHITYNEGDFNAIHDLIKSNQRADNFITPSNLANLDNRIAMAEYKEDEKFTRTQVFGKQIVIVGLNTNIPLRCEERVYEMPPTPQGVLPTINEGYLDTPRLKHIIIIENGQLLTHWWKWSKLLPNEWQEAILIFRGFNDNITTVYNLVKRLPHSCQIGLFFDYDLAGVHLMQSYVNTTDHEYFAFIPSLIDALVVTDTYSQKPYYSFTRYNQKQKFIEQSAKYTSTKLNKPLKAIFNSIHERQLALMQEHMIGDKHVGWEMVAVS